MQISKSLLAQGSQWADTKEQVDFLNGKGKSFSFASFQDKALESGLYPLLPTQITIFQVNLGKMCNQTCKHCHVDAGPDRKEIMTKETMELCLKAIENSPVDWVDLTGGAPEMNPNFRWFVQEIVALGKKVMVRCNLTIILANPKFHDLPDFFAKNKVEVVSSLPYFNASRTDSQRGNGVFEKSIQALKMLNEVGYGKTGTGLTINLVYNPSGAFLPPSQSSLERDFKQQLFAKHGIVFNQLFAITNMPISRYLDYLVASGNYESYMQKLIDNFNPTALQGVMCRNTISVDWQGYFYDCDFNQMLDMVIDKKWGNHVSSIDWKKLNERPIQLGKHCFGCTAGAGSSCGGEIA